MPLFGIPSRNNSAGAAYIVGFLRNRYPDAKILVMHDGGDSDFRDYQSRIEDSNLWSRKDRELWALELALKAGVPTEIAMLAVSPYLSSTEEITTGGARNALLLLAGGAPLWMLDDDVVLPAKRVARSVSDIRTITSFDFSIRVFETHQDAKIDILDIDDSEFAGISTEWLGKKCNIPLSDSVSREGIVRVVTLGHLGSPATSNQRWRVRLAEHEPEQATKILTGTNVVFSVNQPVVAWTGTHFGMAAAYDTASLLPPFPPTGRNQDGAFGALMSGLLRDAAQAWLPICVEHHRRNPWPIITGKRTPSETDLVVSETLKVARRDGNFKDTARRLTSLEMPSILTKWRSVLYAWPSMHAASLGP